MAQQKQIWLGHQGTLVPHSVSTFLLLSIMLLQPCMYRYLKILLSILLFIPQSRIAGSYNNYIFNFFEEPPPCLPQWLHHFTFLPARHLWHMEVPRLRVKSELQLLAYTTATATQDPSCICNLHHSSRQHRIPDPLGKARDQTLILMDASQIHFHWTTREHPGFQFADMLTNTYFILLYQQWTS